MVSELDQNLNSLSRLEGHRVGQIRLLHQLARSAVPFPRSAFLQMAPYSWYIIPFCTQKIVNCWTIRIVFVIGLKASISFLTDLASIWISPWACCLSKVVYSGMFDCLTPQSSRTAIERRWGSTQICKRLLLE